MKLNQDDFWKLISLLVIIGTAITMNVVKLPHELLPYKEWIEFVLGLAGVLQAGRMQAWKVSPPPGGERVPAILLALALGAAAWTFSGCALSGGGPKHVATVTVASAHGVLGLIQDGEGAAVCGRPTAPPVGCVPLEQHRQIAAKLAVAFDYDARVLRLVRASPGAMPADVGTLLAQLTGVVNAIMDLIPDSNVKRAILAQIGGTR